MDNIFITTFKEKFKDLHDYALNNKCKVLVPPKKLVTPSMLNSSFYENHIFLKSKYDQSLYMNLQGKVVNFSESAFTAIIGWKDSDNKMTFNVKDSFTSEEGIEYYSIDNVCDVVTYMLQTTIKNEKTTKCSTRDDYISTFTLEFSETIPNDYEKLIRKVTEFHNLMISNYIFMKGYEEDYAKVFKERGNRIYKEMKYMMNKARPGDDTITSMLSELTDSFVFQDKMYFFIYNNLKEFYQEEQEKFSLKVKEAPIIGLLKEEYKDCKFIKPIELLKQLPEKHTYFEKQIIISQIVKEINDEAKKCLDSKNNLKNKDNPSMEDYRSFYQYVFHESEIDRLISEIQFMKYFNAFSRDISEVSNPVKLFISIVEELLNKFVNSEEGNVVKGVKRSFIMTGAVNWN